MGMAASQARYLALTARKTNTEWEGQQINQARTALSNQSANLFNRLLSMEVPNPPKKTDYTELQYSYSDGDNNSVIEEWQQIKNNNTDYNYVVKHYYMADLFTGSRKTMQDPQVQMGDVLKSLVYDEQTTRVEKTADGINVIYKINNYDYEQQYQKISDAQVEADEKLKEALTSFETAKNYAKADGSLVTDAAYGYQDADGTWHFFIANDYEKVNEVEPGSAKEEALRKYELEKKIIANADDPLVFDSIYGYQDSDDNWHFVQNKAHTEDEYMQAIDFTDYSTVYGPSYIGNTKITELNKLIEDDKLGKTQVSDLAAILKQFPDDSVNKYISFDDDGNLQYEGKGIYTFELLGKTYYATEEDLLNSYDTAQKAKNGIDTQSRLNYYMASMVPTKIESTNNALLETDKNGRFTSVKFDDDTLTYSLNVEEVTNEAAYEDAQNAYLYKKAQYEKTIADINAKTSIIQQEDRTLELRLKQLDTEQNALATEMDAVKKVIKDNVEKTFKTFSD